MFGSFINEDDVRPPSMRNAAYTSCWRARLCRAANVSRVRLKRTFALHGGMPHIHPVGRRDSGEPQRFHVFGSFINEDDVRPPSMRNAAYTSCWRARLCRAAKVSRVRLKRTSALHGGMPHIHPAGGRDSVEPQMSHVFGSRGLSPSMGGMPHIHPIGRRDSGEPQRSHVFGSRGLSPSMGGMPHIHPIGRRDSGEPQRSHVFGSFINEDDVRPPSMGNAAYTSCWRARLCRAAKVSRFRLIHKRRRRSSAYFIFSSSRLIRVSNFINCFTTFTVKLSKA